ncbi:uncharacterized protein LOC116185236 [Apis dorsata]|uniref:uncharacterized protein LOC116185236 n=1 Tax=Apis dorsata TaxID=7462 RepID=UPI001292D14A|nr:uncharacterized protein LOC116185236 [Apis dorsata]
MCTINKSDTIERDRSKLKINSQINLDKCVHSKKLQQKMKSSIDILQNEIKESKSFVKISKSDKNFSTSLAKNFDNFINYNLNNFTTEQTSVSTPKKLVSNNENIFTIPNHKSEISETYDELAILFAQYMKLQTRLCQRKYCFLKRYLKQQTQHTTRKCQMRFNYHRIYPYDQRPMCNSGNICIDTYDELKLMSTSPTERKNIYQHMFKRRKHFLNQPCILSLSN